MGISLSIKNTPEDVVQRLRDRARRNHRSLQGELLEIVQSAARDGSSMWNVDDILKAARARGFRAPVPSTELLREDRYADDR